MQVDDQTSPLSASHRPPPNQTVRQNGGLNHMILACLSFMVLLFVVLIIVNQPGFDRTVTGSYRAASLRFWSGQQLYDVSNIDFLYVPQFAIVFQPFTTLTFQAGESAWRLFTIASLFGSLVLLARHCNQTNTTRPRDTTRPCAFSIVTLMTIPLAFSAARNGQVTLVLIASMICFSISLASKRHWLACLFCCVGIICKPYMIVPMLLAMALSKSFTVRMVISLLIFGLVPMAFASPSYVLTSYQDYISILQARSSVTGEGTFSDIFGLFHAAGWTASQFAQFTIRLVAAFLTLGFAFNFRRRHSFPETAFLLWPLSSFYVLLFSPGTENNTYAMLGPVLGIMVYQCHQQRLFSMGWLIIFGLVIMVVQRPLSMLVSTQEPLWLMPLCAIALFIPFCELLRKRQQFNRFVAAAA